ncbi:MAG: c-type cytochrome [Chitinophagales bacterium]|nr:c-type cytochrome [Chitinophagales bacterium]
MKKMLVTAALFFITIAAIYFSACNNTTADKPAAGDLDSVKQLVERGHYLAHYVTQCMDCHSVRDTGKFSMPVVPGTEGGGSAFPFGKAEGVPGEVTPPNITPFALKDWTDEEIIRAITGGINKRGDTLFPLMPYQHYSKMAKNDILAIVAYIRSLKPIERTTPPRRLEIPLSMLGPLPVVNLDNNSIPDKSDKIKYGEYIVNAAVCSECHTPMGPQGPDFSKLFAGGFVFDLPMFKVTVANITPDSATGIGTWTEEMFLAKFKTNGADEMVNKYPGRKNSIMPWAMYAKMGEEELKAVYAYLRTVKPVSNKVEKYPQ